jgi:hypothetical protein
VDVAVVGVGRLHHRHDLWLAGHAGIGREVELRRQDADDVERLSAGELNRAANGTICLLL